MFCAHPKPAKSVSNADSGSRL